MTGPTIHDALQAAHAYWEAKGPSSRMMPIRANECAKALDMRTPLDKLSKADGAKVLTRLRSTGKAKGSIQAYYAAFKRALELAGGNCRDWPKADTPPRKCREPLSEADLERLAEALRGYSYTAQGVDPEDVIISGPREDDYYTIRAGAGWETYDLLELLRGTGLRVDVEALSWDACKWDPVEKLLRVTGKGGHERVIPVERPETVGLLNSPERMKALRRLSYSGHLKRWTAAVERLACSASGGIDSLKPTPHAVRHYYATRAYAKSGRNLRVVQELLGHADIGTTARYLGVDMDELRSAVS